MSVTTMKLQDFHQYLLKYVFSFCDAGDLVMVSFVNRYFNKLCKKPDTWKHIITALASQGFEFSNCVSPLLYGKLHCCELKLQLEAASTLRKMLSIEFQPPIAKVVKAGVVPKLVDIMKERLDSKLMFESAWALTNIASGASEFTQVVIDSGSIPVFVSMMEDCVGDVKEQALWAIGNIAGDSPVTRDMVLRSGVTGPLLSIAKYAEPPMRPNNGFKVVYSPPLALLRNCAWCISNLCRGKTPRPFFEDIEPFIPALVQMLQMTDVGVLTDTAWAFSYITDDDSFDNFRIQAVLETGVVKRLVNLLHHDCTEVVVPALRTVGNIVTGADYQTQAVVDNGALEAFVRLLNHSKKSIRKETAWTISNITAGTSRQIQEVLNVGLLPQLVKRLASDESDVKKECAWAVSNIVAGGTAKQISAVVSSGALIHMLGVLSCGDQRVMEAILEAFEKILRTDVALCEKLIADETVVTTAASEDRISGTQVRRILLEATAHYSPGVTRLATQILNEYFVM